MTQMPMHCLKQKLISTITSHGPLTISQFMSFCLADPQFGYYKTAEPFGRDGDFITAPEVSQMFGEIVGIWAVLTWRSMGQPSPFALCEMGPGRGTLMDDVLRTIHKLDGACFKAAQIYLIESSAKLQEKQKQRLEAHGTTINWLEQFSALPSLPLILFANELFDCLPIHQYIFDGQNWHERMVGLSNAESGTAELVFCTGSTIANVKLPYALDEGVRAGAILEVSPARESLMDEIADHIAHYRGGALIIDYGALQPQPNDTLQAMSKHRFCHPLENPGLDDLTSHVDFTALALRARQLECQTYMTTQGQFLIGLGLLERAQNLGRGKDHAFQEKIRNDVERLASDNQMGKLFKVLCVNDIKTPFLAIGQ